MRILIGSRKYSILMQMRKRESCFPGYPTVLKTFRMLSPIAAFAIAFVVLFSSVESVFAQNSQNTVTSKNDDAPLTSPQMMQLQAALNRLGYNAGSVDGKSGSRTGNAVAAFLRDRQRDPYSTSPSEALQLVLQARGVAGSDREGTTIEALAPEGYWSGSYVCGQGKTGMVMRISARNSGGQEAQASFFPLAENPDVARGSYLLDVAFDAENQAWDLTAREWINAPSGYTMVSMSGKFSADQTELTGLLKHDYCTTFALSRVDRATADQLITGRPASAAPTPLEVAPKIVNADALDRNAEPQTAKENPISPASAPSIAVGLDLAGIWEGVVVCKQRAQKASLELHERNGALNGFFRSFNTIKVAARLTGEDSFELTLGEGKRKPRSGKLVRTDGLFPYLSVNLGGQCRDAVLVKPALSPEIGGRVAYTVKQNGMEQVQFKYLCQSTLKTWFDSASDERNLALGLNSRYSPYLSEFDGGTSMLASLFSDEAFTIFFGKPASAFSEAGFAEVQKVIQSCIVVNDDTPMQYETTTGYKLFKIKSIGAARNEMLSTGAPAPDKLVPTFPFANFKASRRDPRPTVASVLPDWKLKLAGPDPIAEVGAYVQANAAELSSVPPKEVDAGLTEIFGAARAAKATAASASSKSNPLAERVPSVMTADHLDSHELISAVFGHYIYAEQGELVRCSVGRPLPVQVRLSSLLPLGQFNNPRYLRSFFFYAFSMTSSACGWDFGGGGNTMDAEFIYDGEVVARASIRSHDRDFSVSNIEVLRDPVAHPASHPDFAFDKAFAQMLGDTNAVSALELPEFTDADLSVLGERGDLQALFHSAIRGENRFNFDFGRPVEFDVAAMRRASSSGSAAAAFMLGFQLARETKIIRTGRGAGEPNDFASLSTAQQQEFRYWYAKAKAGGIYYSRYLDEAGKRWGIETDELVADFRKNGFVNSPEDFSNLSVDNSKLTKERARRALNAYFLAERCNKTFNFLNAPDGGGALGSIFANYDVSNGACIVRQPIVDDTIIISYRISSVETISCSSGNRCDMIYRIGIDWRNTGARSNLQVFDLVYGTIFKAAQAVPYKAEANLAYDGQNWNVVGKPDFHDGH